MLTKSSKRAVRGASSPSPCVHAGAFLRLVGIISTVSKPLRHMRSGGRYVCARGTRAYVPLRCDRILTVS